jgi:predicted DCC family thiol-disulfide oxidoreductase YuxK
MTAYPLTIYYDASCPLCANEMHALHARAPAGSLELVDCSADGFDARAFAACGIDRAAMMERIHARDATGRWLVGVEVFEAAYAAAGFTRLARWWGHPRLRPLWDRLYPWVARNRQVLSRLGLARVYAWIAGSPCRGDRCQNGAKRSER